MIYLLTEIGLTPGGSSTLHIYTQTIHRTTQLTVHQRYRVIFRDICQEKKKLCLKRWEI